MDGAQFVKSVSACSAEVLGFKHSQCGYMNSCVPDEARIGEALIAEKTAHRQ